EPVGAGGHRRADGDRDREVARDADGACRQRRAAGVVQEDAHDCLVREAPAAHGHRLARGHGRGRDCELRDQDPVDLVGPGDQLEAQVVAGEVASHRAEGGQLRGVTGVRRSLNGRERPGQCGRVGVNDSQIFWSDGADGTIHSANLDGTNPQTINTGPLFVRSVAANDYNVYWAIGDVGGPIVEANLDG